MDFKIPKTFQIFGKTITVKQPWKVDREDSRGEWLYEKAVIKLRRSLNIEEKEVVFWHETVHSILDTLEYNDLSNDERFVERFSKALHQVLKTAK